MLALKAAAWWITGSAALYSDALESIVNVAASLIALGALHFAAIPAEVLGGASRAEAATHAAEVTEPALRALGLDDDQVRAVVDLHRLELELRDARAWLLRREVTTTSSSTGTARA